jgi:hypothetical protein
LEGQIAGISDRALPKSSARNALALSAAPLVSAALATSTTVTAATAAVTPTPTAAAVAPATAAIAAATTTATRRTWFARTRFVHGQGPTFNGLAIELGDRLLRIAFARHRDEREAARFTGELVLHQRDFLDWADAGKHVLEIGFRGVEGKISYV